MGLRWGGCGMSGPSHSTPRKWLPTPHRGSGWTTPRLLCSNHRDAQGQEERKERASYCSNLKHRTTRLRSALLNAHGLLPAQASLLSSPVFLSSASCPFSL